MSPPGQANGPNMLVLGSAGFIGEHLTRHLDNQDDIGGIELLGHRSAEMRWRKSRSVDDGDLGMASLRSCSVPDVVFWATGGSSVAASICHRDADYARTVPPLEALLEMLQGPWKSTHLIFLSSAAVYGASASNSTRTSDALTPVSPYGEHKLLSELLIRASLPEGRFSIVRPFSVYGPGLRKQLLWDALCKLARGERQFFGTGHELRDWVWVGDLVRLLVYIARDPGNCSSTLNAGSGNATTVRDTLRLLFSAAGNRQEPVFDNRVRIGDPMHLVASLDDQAPDVASYFSTKLDFGIKHYCSWFAEAQLEC